MYLFDCTLRDGANVVGSGFSAELTKLMIEGLIQNNIKVIEMGNAMGMGMDQDKSPLIDEAYLELIQPYLSQAEIGMFIGVKNAVAENIDKAAAKGLHFLRIGANAGDGDKARDGIARIKKAGMKARFSMMKGYILSADDLADEATRLESYGLDEVTIMDSAGTMLPEQVTEYVSAMVKKVKIPVGFHGHNNLGLSVANALAAARAGATSIDTGLMGMARSAGNLPTEIAVAAFQRIGLLKEIDLFGLLNFIDQKLAPGMREYHYQASVSPFDLALGFAGCHSNFSKLFLTIAKEKEVDVHRLIVKVSEIDRKMPSADLIERIATQIKNSEN